MRFTLNGYAGFDETTTTVLDHCHRHHWYEWLDWAVPIVGGVIAAIAICVGLKKRRGKRS